MGCVYFASIQLAFCHKKLKIKKSSHFPDFPYSYIVEMLPNSCCLQSPISSSVDKMKNDAVFQFVTTKWKRPCFSICRNKMRNSFVFQLYQQGNKTAILFRILYVPTKQEIKARYVTLTCCNYHAAFQRLGLRVGNWVEHH